MKKTRYTPFGYVMENGKIVINEEEAQVVRQIFEEYIKGSSFKLLADELNRRNIAYNEGNVCWNKGNLNRLLNNSKYIGNNGYPPIISGELFQKAASCKAERMKTGDKNSDIDYFRNMVFCPVCNCRMVRKYEKRNVIKESWECKNQECKMKVKIPDGVLIEKITGLLNMVTGNLNLSESYQPQVTDLSNNLSIIKQQNEFNRQLEKIDFSEDDILGMIFHMAKEKYELLGCNELIDHDLKSKSSLPNRQFYFGSTVFRNMVKKVYIESGEVKLLLKNDVTIGQENGDARDCFTAKDSYTA